MTAFQSKFIIECLRAGIASSDVSALFSHGQTRLVQAFQEHLTRGDGAMAIEGGYGQGKTHLLKHLAQVARRRGYVVSLVTLSKETPFHHWWHLYGQAIAQAERPDASHEPALRGLLRRQKWGDEVVQPLYEFGEQVHPRLAVALRCYYESRDGEVQHRVAGDLMGHALTNGELGRIYREARRERVKLPAARLTQTGRDYFAFAGKLFQLAGYAGWVILFDEFELVCKLSALQRARAHANLAAFRQSPPLPGFERTLAVAAFIPGMVTDFLVGGAADLANLPERLRMRGEDAEAQAAEASIRWLVEQKHSLAMLDEADTVEVLDQIAGLHERAYGWRRPPGRFYVPSMSAAERMRTKVRYCVEALDLAYLYGEAPIIQPVEAPLPKLAEDAELFAGRVEDVVVEEVDR
jgi:bacteriophage exclusion system BrxC/D-like protein